MTEAPNINGCKFCDEPKIGHAMRWHPEKSWHSWHTPTDAQRKARWKEHVNAKEAARRQKLIKDTLVGLDEIVNTGLVQELDPEQEEVLKLLIAVAVHKLQVEL